MDVVIDLVRDGETTWEEKLRNLPAPVFGGRMDAVHLSQTGESQARACGEFALMHGIHPTLFIVSPANRSGQMHRISAAAMNRSNVASSIDQRFCEMNWGHWTGKSRDIARTTPLQRAFGREGMDLVAPGGESYASVRVRARTALLELVRSVPDGSHVWVYTHGDVIKSLVWPFLKWSVVQTWLAQVKPASLTRFRYTGKLQLEFYDQSTLG